MGEWAQLSRDAQRALPGFLDQGKSIAGNVQLAKGGEADVVAVFPDLSSAAAAQYQIVGPPRDAVIRLMYVALTRAGEKVVICQRATDRAVTI